MNRLSRWPVCYQEKAKASPIQFRSTDPSSDTVPRLLLHLFKTADSDQLPFAPHSSIQSASHSKNNSLVFFFFLKKNEWMKLLWISSRMNEETWTHLSVTNFQLFPKPECCALQDANSGGLIPLWKKNGIANGPPGRNGAPAFQWKRFKFRKKNTKKIIKLRKRKTTLIDSCTATSSFIFKLKHHLKKKKRVCTWVEMLHAEKSSFSPASPVGLGAAKKIKSSSWQKPF